MSILSKLQNKKLGFFELLVIGYSLYLNNFRIFVSLTCTLLPFGIIPNILVQYQSLNTSLSILNYFLFLFYFVFVIPAYTSAFAILVESFILPKKTQRKVVFKQILHRILPLVVLNIRFYIILYLRFLLLIIPGIIYAVNNGFYTLTFILRDQRGKAAFQYSRSLVKGHWWRVFLFYLLYFVSIIGLQLIISKILSSLSSVIPNNPILVNVIFIILTSLANPGIIISSFLLFLNLDFQKR